VEEDRREFLKKFALLSSVPILFNGCPNAVYGPPPSSEDNDTIHAVYGPPPIIKKEHIIYYRDIKDNLILLNSRKNIPLEPTIVIKFPNKMGSESKNSITLLDEKDELISCNKKWKTEYILEIQPIEDSLKYDSNYSLIIDKTIQNKDGDLLDTEKYFFGAYFTTLRENEHEE